MTVCQIAFVVFCMLVFGGVGGGGGGLTDFMLVISSDSSVDLFCVAQV